MPAPDELPRPWLGRASMVAALLVVLVACSGGTPPTQPPADEPRSEGPTQPSGDPAVPPAAAGGAEREALAFEARTLDGPVVDVAAEVGGGAVALWMWAPW